MSLTPKAAQWIEQGVAAAMERFDPAYGLLSTRRQVHHHTVDVPDGWYHAPRESAYLCLGLLECCRISFRASWVAAATDILGSLARTQAIADPDAPWYGLWHYYVEQPVAEWQYKDYNWACFIATALLLVLIRHRDALPADAIEDATLMIRRAVICVGRRDVRPEYTNIAALSSFVMIAAGELLADAALRASGIDKVRALSSILSESNAVDEYFSPGYTGVALVGLHCIEGYTRDPDGVSAARIGARCLWNHIADGWHSSGELCGPHSRAYTVRQGLSWIAALVHVATDGTYEPDDDEIGELPKIACLLQRVDLPHHTVNRFLDPGGDRVVSGAGEAHATPAGPRRTHYTAYLTSEWCVGSVDLQDSRTDRQNLVAYWRGHDRSGYLIARSTTSHADAAFGLYLCAAQDRGTVLAAFFPSEFDDPSPMRPRDGTDTALIETGVEVDGGGTALTVTVDQAPVSIGECVPLGRQTVCVLAGPAEIALRPIPCGDLSPRLQISEDGRSMSVRWTWYQGGFRRVRWHELEGDASAFLLSFRDPSSRRDQWLERIESMDVTVSRSDDQFAIDCGVASERDRSLQLLVPRRVLPMQELYARFLR